MKTVVEKKNEKEERKDELKECFVLWRHTSKTGNYYLTGQTSKDVNGGIRLVGYFNSKKKNPKEPDVRVYEIDSEGKQGNEVADLWANVSKNENKYFTGMTNDKEKLVGFYGDENKELRPYIRVYFQQD